MTSGKKCAHLFSLEKPEPKFILMGGAPIKKCVAAEIEEEFNVQTTLLQLRESFFLYLRSLPHYNYSTGGGGWEASLECHLNPPAPPGTPQRRRSFTAAAGALPIWPLRYLPSSLPTYQCKRPLELLRGPAGQAARQRALLRGLESCDAFSARFS